MRAVFHLAKSMAEILLNARMGADGAVVVLRSDRRDPLPACL